MFFKKRNLASALETLSVSGNAAVWTDWSIAKAVKDGYKASGWVYKAVSLISRNAATVPFVVKDKDDKILWDHPLTKLFLNPHPYLNRVQYFELLIQWIQLAGNAYMKKLDDSRVTKELWPISPDRIAPIESKDTSTFVDGYETKDGSGTSRKDPDLTTENIIHLNLIDPANPLQGISPLQACARAVDADVSQQNWNVSAMQNRGVVDGVFTFKSTLESGVMDTIMKRIMAKFSGSSAARKPLVLGSDATYTRLSLTPTEMDFLESRKFNRDEIFIIYGVPPQLGGSQESATYNNFAVSMRIFWEVTLIPLLQMFATQFTASFKDSLTDGQYIGNDLSGVEALRENQTEKAATSKLYYDMGVPFEQINTKFELGFKQYEGWEKPFNGLKQTKDSTTTQAEEKRSLVLSTETRSIASENAKKKKLAEGPVVAAWESLLKRQELSVYLALSNNEDAVEVVKTFSDETRQLITNITVSVASQFADTVVVEKRGTPLNFEHRGGLEDELIDEYLKEEAYILEELSFIQQNTIDTILQQVRDGAEKGYSYELLRKALEDTGVFSPERALRIARTEVGSSASIGQFASAKVAGADFKIWNTAGAETRSAHVARSGEEVGIDERFSAQISAIGPRWPLDPKMSASDRINCDCFLTFRVD